MDRAPDDIFDLLYRLGISANYNGFLQTAYAVELCRAEPERLQLVTKMVYPDVAKLCATSCGAVERNIRTACEVAWKNNRRLLEQLACKPISQKPHNTLFLSILLSNLPIYQSIPSITGKAGLIDHFPPCFQQKETSGEQEGNNQGM